MKFEPGVVEGLDIAEYHDMTDTCSKTWLDAIDLSPAICYARCISVDRPARTEKPGQLEGNMAHCAVLEPASFGERYIVGPDWNRNTNKWKEYEQKTAAEYPGCTIIKPAQYEVAMRQAEAVRALPEIRDALAAGKPELSAFWIDPETGAQCRCRPDWTHPCGDGSAILLDLKTYTDSSPREFRKQIGRKSYAKQDSMYSDGYEIASGHEVRAFIFACVSTEFPYAASACMLDDDSREAGRRHYRRNLETYADCIRTGVWPGYSSGIEIVRLPEYLITEEL